MNASSVFPRARFLLRLAAGACVVLALHACSEDDVELVLTWEDEFEGPAGQLPDANNWRFDVGVNWGNNQLEYDTARSENVSLDGNGNLAITARRETYTDANDVTREYTSGRIKTEDLFEQRYGRFEARIRLPVGRGLWPAFWLLGADFDLVGWPQCGEIDIMEYRGQQPRTLIGSLHGPGYSGGNSFSRTTQLSDGLNNDFHVYAVEWDSERIVWTIDGDPYHAISQSGVSGRGQWVFDHPFFIILNVAVGGNFVGSPDPTTNFPQTMLVDWVRVYGEP